MQDKLRKILEYYGEDAQAKKSREELSELTIGIIKKDLENIKEEIADVKVMTKQVLMFDGTDKQRYKRVKRGIFEYYKDFEAGAVENELQLQILEVQKCLIRSVLVEFSVIALECLLDRYMDINNISKEEIEKEMERKINRQLERIEREKVNK